MENWEEVRTAYQVARLGTISAAAKVLGVHHATVIRHIDAIEARLGVKLFQRHPRGYTATESGRDLLRVAQATEDQFNQLSGRVRGQGDAVDGELVVTSLGLLAALLVPALAGFRAAYPDLTLRYLTGARLFRLEYGEAHVAIRAGAAPEQPDNVVQPFMHQRFGLYAARSYAERRGLPGGEGDLAQHIFVGPDDETSRAPTSRWMFANLPGSAIRFRCSDPVALEMAVRQGAGIGFLPAAMAATEPDIVEVLPPRDAWSVPLWLVTHVDLHRSIKVQTFLDYLKDHASRWEA